MKLRRKLLTKFIGNQLLKTAEARTSLYVGGRAINQPLWEKLWDLGLKLEKIYKRLVSGKSIKAIKEMKSKDRFAHIHFCPNGHHWWLHEGDAKCFFTYEERSEIEKECMIHKKVRKYPRYKIKFPRFYHCIKRSKLKDGIRRYARVR